MEYINFKSSSNGSVDCAYLLMDSLILHKGHVVHVIDPSSFWMRIGVDADFKEFDHYQKTLNKFYNEKGRKYNVSVDTLAQGDCVVVADTSCSQINIDEDENRADLHWNRARVSRMDGDKVDVFYIDLGYTEIVDMYRVKTIDKKLFDYIPSLAIQLGIAGIRPLARSWTSRAVNMFASKVLDQEVLVCLIDYDEVSKFGVVVIYIQYDSCRWRSLTHAMLDEDLGLPFEPMIDEFLSQEEVLAALARGEQDSSLNSGGPDSSRSENADVSLNETESRENLFVAKPGQSVSSWEPGQHVQPDGFSTPIPPHHSSLSSENAGAQVPAFDLSSLVHTRSLSLSKMQEDKVEEQRLLIRAKLEQELKDSEEDDTGEHEIDWGKSDLWIGEAGAFSDFDNIRQEIYKHFDHPDENDFHKFFYTSTETTEIQKENLLGKFSFVEEQSDKEKTPRDCSEKADLKPLTEMEDYEIQKKIKEILSGKDGGELNMVCVLINSIIEPDLSISCDRLITVFTAILETLVHNSDSDPLIALAALETYLGTSAFETAITTVLKSLRCSCVKLPQTKRSSNSHSAFTELLVTLFIRAGNWPPSSCLLIHEFVMASLERWVIFNKQRAQTSDSSTDLEKLYLECVEVFLDSAGEMLRQRFPDHFCSLIDEMKHKLLHDSTQRIIREKLLNILLKVQAHVPLSTPKSASVKRDIGAQTEPNSDYPSGKDNEDFDEMHSAVDKDMNIIDDLDCLEIVGSRFQNSSSSNTSISWFDDVCDDAESLDNADTISDANSVGYVALCNISDYSEPSVTFSNLSHSVLTSNNTGLPKASQGVSPHLQGEHFSDDSFQDDITAGDTSDDIQQIKSEEFNANAAEFTCSTSQSFSIQEEQEQTQSGDRLETHVTKGERCDVNNSKPHGVTAEKQNVYKLNVSAPEFTPKLSSSCANLDQASVSLSSVDGYMVGLGSMSVMSTGSSNSDFTRPVQCDMEIENAVEDYLSVAFAKEGMDQQEDNRVSNNETYATVSDPEKALEYHSPPPLGITNEDNISSHSSEKTAGNEGMISQEIITSSPTKVVGSIGIINQGDIVGPPSPKETVGSVGLINQSDIFRSPSPKKAVESVEAINQTDIIRYTAKELKALNTGTTSAYLIDMSVTEESSAADHVVKTEKNQADQQETDVTSSPFVVPYRRYTGRGDNPLEISFGPKSNSAKWKSLSELLPPSNLKSGQFAVEPSLHPEPVSDAVLHASEKAIPNSLQSIAQSLFPTKDQPVSENDYMGCDENSAFPAMAGDYSGREVNSCEYDEAKIVRNLNDSRHAAVPEWPEALFRSVGSAEDNTQSTFAPNKNEKRKAKKKIKFRPAGEVLAEKSGDNWDENKMPVDDEGYRIDAEVEDNEVGGHVIHQPKLGVLCSSSSKRSSWLTEVKQGRPRADKWVPGTRKCTRCGSTDHTIYDCPQEDPFQRPSNQAYFL